MCWFVDVLFIVDVLLLICGRCWLLYVCRYVLVCVDVCWFVLVCVDVCWCVLVCVFYDVC